MSISLFDYITNNTDSEGRLPKTFSLPEEGDGTGLRFADGALDGISIYHMGHTPLTDEEKARLGELMTLAANGGENKAEDGFAEFCSKHRAITVIDDLQEYISEHSESLDPRRSFDFAVHMLKASSDRECVKIGLSILEMFNISNDDALKDAVRTVGLSDEFTIFSVFLMRRWPNAEEEILSLAKKVRGWGRIHCIDFLQPATEAAKDWLFLNGVDNDVVPAYSAWTVYEKADVEERMKKETLTYEEVHALLQLTAALLDEGPVSGISNMDDPDSYLKKVLSLTEGHTLTDEDKDIIDDISNRLSDH